jgi:hypothetical protein
VTAISTKRMLAAILAFLVVAAAAVGVEAAPAAASGPRTSCPVTKPNNRHLPGLFGNRRLATTVYETIEATSRTLMPNGWIGEKFPWRGYGVSGELAVTGRRLDGRAKPLRADIRPAMAPDAPEFWAVGIAFPTVGCWRITGRVGSASLTLVVRVVDPLGLVGHERTPQIACSAHATRNLVRRFLAAFDRGDRAELARLLAPSAEFGWYAVNGPPGERIQDAAKNRSTLLAYLARRHAHSERLTLERFRFAGYSLGKDQFAFEAMRSADDLGVPTRYGGKGAVNCWGHGGIAVWAMGPSADQAG